MNKKLVKPLIFLLIVCMLCTCIDPYSPKLNGFKSLLVVDAFLTNENRSYFVKLSRTNEVQNIETTMESGALVMIKDQSGNNSLLYEISAGIYKTDSLLFNGETGNSYILYIKTPEGTEYESEPCLMYPVTQIDSILYTKDQEITNNGSETNEGIRIFVNSKSSEDSKYFRLVYNEWWKFSVQYPKKFNYINENTIFEVDQIKQVCWNSKSSDEIIIQSTESGQTNKIEKEPILFIASDKSDRLLIQYCIEVRQLSLSKREFEFWDHMKQIHETGGDIFEKQPFSIVSNIHNISNPDEPVLGYFQVSAAKQKRIYITAKDISDLNIPLYHYDCERIEAAPGDYPSSQDPATKMTFDKIYNSYTIAGYDFVEPIYDMRWNLQKLVFSKPSCTNCTLEGSLKKPDFWIDLDLRQKTK
jgi:Domain of unknown function (DUF4249)